MFQTWDPTVFPILTCVPVPTFHPIPISTNRLALQMLLQIKEGEEPKHAPAKLESGKYFAFKISPTRKYLKLKVVIEYCKYFLNKESSKYLKLKVVIENNKYLNLNLTSRLKFKFLYSYIWNLIFLFLFQKN